MDAKILKDILTHLISRIPSEEKRSLT